MLIGWHRLSIKRVLSILDCVSKVLHPFIIYVLILDSKKVLLLFFVLQGNVEVVNTGTHQPAALFYFLDTIDEGDFELFLELIVDVHDCYLVFEGIEHQMSFFEAVCNGSHSKDVSLADVWLHHPL